ncbi:hypothetical protein KFZ76_20230 [Methylovulum psychrotolerans]|jgi:hypothetical protein|uniref:Uncharacterized protein n=2 Tax=Methylovulum psychrotolerans TaxID=1704499 RepID=A0A2S5CFX8_9GAMM|nr:hypothetical protein [Methylovulum psychrotolerans]MBT9100033.1 hypothetical protein [Methylovulum psychrotolerans]POZ49642.1 hypothetical protein AADEFJLK_04589 [Methylovulum psychrotolerans]
MEEAARFYCEKLTATLQVQTCKQRYLSGNFLVCKGCAVGAGHAGVKAVRVDLSHTCSRCQAQAQRLIGKKLCISCYNRQLEFKSGKNRRGNPPRIKIADVALLVVSRSLLRVYRDNVTSMAEVWVELVRRGDVEKAALPLSLTRGVPFQYDLFA